jgi:hypothetical protein
MSKKLPNNVSRQTSKDFSAFSIIAKRCAPPTHTYNELAPLLNPQARHKCGQFGVLFSGD